MPQSSAHGRQRQSSVRGVAGLTAALANPLLDHILLEAGTYPLISPLLIERSVVLEAAQPGTVVLDGLGVSRVLSIGLPGLSPAVELIGLNITRGSSFDVSQTKLSIARWIHGNMDSC